MSEQIVNDKRLKGIISIMISAAGFAGMSFFVKLSGKVPVIEKAMFRNAVALVVAYIIMRREGVSFYVEKKNRLPLFLRCFFGTAGLICNFWAIGYLKLGDSSILQKMAPFFSPGASGSGRSFGRFLCRNGFYLCAKAWNAWRKRGTDCVLFFLYFLYCALTHLPSAV